MRKRSLLVTSDETTTVAELRKRVKSFVHEREWESFHSPRNLAESICIEAAELLEGFQWDKENRTGSLSDKYGMQYISRELADIMIYCLSFANVTGLDLSETIAKKLEINSRRYPVRVWRGRATLE